MDVILTVTGEDVGQTVTVSFRGVTDCLEVPTGEYEVEIPGAGFSTTVDLAAEDYIAVALGKLEGETEFTVTPFYDTDGANIGDDEARVRAVHASPDAPAVDVTVDGDAPTLFEDVGFGESSGHAVVGAGEHNVKVRPAGGGDPVVDAGVTLDGRSTDTVFAVDFLEDKDEDGDPDISLLPVKDAGAPPRGDGDEDDRDDNGRGRGGGDDEGGDDNGNGRGRGCGRGN